MRIVAHIKRSSGNDTVGEMWTETKTFDSQCSLAEIYAWAEGICSGMITKQDILLTVDQYTL